MDGPGRASLTGVAIALIVAACQAAPVPSHSTPSSVFGSATPRAIVVPSPTPAATPSASPSPMPFTGWRAIPADPSIGGTDLTDVVISQFGMFAIGRTNGTNPAGEGRAVILHSDDGQSWTMAADDVALGGGDPFVGAIATGRDGIAVLGTAGARSGDRYPQTVLWFSKDGSTWERVPLPLPPTTTESFDGHGVAYRSGRWVIVGELMDPRGPRAIRPLVLWSTDAHAWRSSSFDGSRDMDVADVGASETGFVADGHIRSSVVLWTSRDGDGWRVAQRLGDAMPTGRIRAFGFGTMVVSYATIDPGVGPGPMLLSTDNRHWTAVTVPGLGNGVFDAIDLGGARLAVGRSSDRDQPMAVALSDGRPTDWRSLPEEPLFSGTLVLSLALNPDHTGVVGVGNSEANGIFFLPIPGDIAPSG